VLPPHERGRSGDETTIRVRVVAGRRGISEGASVKMIGGLGPRDPEGTRAPSAPSGAASPTHAADLRIAQESLRGSTGARRLFAERMRCVPKYLAVMNAKLGRPFTDHELEDLVQETLVEIWRKLESYQGLAALPTWAYRFCQHVLSTKLRSAGRRPVPVGLDDARARATRATSSLDFEHVYAALERLDARDAEIVRARHFDELTFEAIGLRLSMPESSAKASYHRALARLKELLGPQQREAGP
jgi:RNA polymerase sigma-70 factor, ECF subfamily